MKEKSLNLESLNSEFAQSKTEFAKIESELSVKSQTLEDIHKEFAQTKSALETAQSQVHNLEKSKSALEAKISEENVKSEKREESVTPPDDSSASQKVAELEDIVMRSAAEMAFMKSKLVRLEELEKIEQKFTAMSETNKKLKQLVLKNKKELEEGKKKLKKEFQEKEKIQEKLKEASSKASNATSSFQEEYDRLQAELRIL